MNLRRLFGTKSPSKLTADHGLHLTLTVGIVWISISLFLLYIIDAYSDIKPRGLLAPELYHFSNAGSRPNFDISGRQKLFTYTILLVGLISLWIKGISARYHLRFSASTRILSYINGIAILSILGLYLLYSFKIPGYTIFYSLIFTTMYITLNTSNNAALKKMISFFLYGASAILFSIVIWQSTKFGNVPYLFYLPDLFSCDNHLTVLLSSTYRLADGYHWLQGIQPTYGILLPTLAEPILQYFSFSLTSWFYFLESLQFMFIVMFLISMFLQSKSPITFLAVCASLFDFNLFSTNIYFPNHFAWRFVGIAISMLCLSLGCYFKKRISYLQKSLLSSLLFFLNFETGIVFFISFAASEFFSKKQGILRSLKFVFYFLLLTILALYLFFNLSPLSLIDSLQFTRIVSSALGGWRYFAIPAFVTIVTHSTIIIWRTARSGIRTAQQDVGFIAAMYCLLWSMYFVTRPDFVNFPSLLIVYAFVVYRLWSDVSFVLQKNRLLTSVTAGLLLFAYLIYPYNALANFLPIPISKFTRLDAMQPIVRAAAELKLTYHEGDGYITPFTFFTRAISGKPNNLPVADPFILISLEKEQVDFLKSRLPARLLLPKIEKLFINGPPQVEYSELLEKIKGELRNRHYHANDHMKYWVEYIHTI